MIIRDAVEAELPAIVEIYNAAIRSRISTAQLEQVSVADRVDWFRQHSAKDYPLWVATMEKQIAGWLSFHPFLPRSAYRGTFEISLYVDQQFRRRGIGRAFLEKAVSHSRILKLHTLVGCIFAHNVPSLRLFDQLGFERWGLLPGVARVDDVTRDLVIVGRHVQ